jgi:hypothetical protein
MRMKARALLAGVAIAAAAIAPATDALAQAKGAKKAGNCELKRGRGWAPTEAMARFQAWEIIAQTTGNWPIMSDTFKNEKYKCQPDPAGYKCESAIQVCKT